MFYVIIKAKIVSFIKMANASCYHLFSFKLNYNSNYYLNMPKLCDVNPYDRL